MNEQTGKTDRAIKHLLRNGFTVQRTAVTMTPGPGATDTPPPPIPPAPEKLTVIPASPAPVKPLLTPSGRKKYMPG